ncbi:hypothetical protein A4X09_0g7284 [Tilletia walkeri]|uniref:Uncharacterized protein n=1 Tax=Tilletia walkeri TaxID=117179 RepID=A0A8X7T1K2_9BASI|nr:hypothetical protein A4X09_0g7284 [Tilletia walkeri]
MDQGFSQDSTGHTQETGLYSLGFQSQSAQDYAAHYGTSPQTPSSRSVLSYRDPGTSEGPQGAVSVRTSAQGGFVPQNVTHSDMWFPQFQAAHQPQQPVSTPIDQLLMNPLGQSMMTPPMSHPHQPRLGHHGHHPPSHRHAPLPSSGHSSYTSSNHAPPSSTHSHSHNSPNPSVGAPGAGISSRGAPASAQDAAEKARNAINVVVERRVDAKFAAVQMKIRDMVVEQVQDVTLTLRDVISGFKAEVVHAQSGDSGVRQVPQPSDDGFVRMRINAGSAQDYFGMLDEIRDEYAGKFQKVVDHLDRLDRAVSQLSAASSRLHEKAASTSSPALYAHPHTAAQNEFRDIISLAAGLDAGQKIWDVDYPANPTQWTYHDSTYEASEPHQEAGAWS